MGQGDRGEAVGLLGEDREQHLDRLAADRFLGLADRGERRLEGAGVADVIEADDGDIARAIETAIEAVLVGGMRTADLASGGPSVGTREMAAAISAAL